MAGMALVASLTIDLNCLQRRRGWRRRPSSSVASCDYRAASGVEAGGGVRARAWQAAAIAQQAASRLAAASELERGKLRLSRSKRRRGWRRRPSSSVASCDYRAASGVEAGGGVRARAWQAAAIAQQGSRSSMAGMALVASLTIDLNCLQRRRG
ncbi:hypothetical protein PR003_g33834, partial [Phytophthora rubi]